MITISKIAFWLFGDKSFQEWRILSYFETNPQEPISAKFESVTQTYPQINVSQNVVYEITVTS